MHGFKGLLASLVVATAVALVPVSTAVASGGANFVATGHDMDFHCAYGTTEECDYFKRAVNVVLAGSAKPVLILDKGSNEAVAAFTIDFPGHPYTELDPSSPAFAALTASGFEAFGAMIVASDASCGGCDLNPSGGTEDSDAIAKQKANIATAFNNGMGILALAGACHGDNVGQTSATTGCTGSNNAYYSFVPLPIGGAAVSPPFTVTSVGMSAFGFPDATTASNDANCCATHNSFSLPSSSSSLKVAEQDSMGLAETLVALNATIGGGGFGGGGGGTDQSISASGNVFSGIEGQSFTHTVATFTDPDSTAKPGDYSATISWGDGTTSTGTIRGSGGSFSVSGTHTYAEEGTYKATVKITDVDNPSNSATANSTGRVADAGLSAACAAPATTSPAYGGPVASFQDAAGGSSDPADMSATIDWGDGTTSAGTVSPTGGGSYSVSGSHTYTSTGPFTITTHISDRGGSTTSASCQVLTFAFAPGGGAFVIGDRNSGAGQHVEFWGAQWWNQNSPSGGSAPASFKGFALNPARPSCGVSWSTSPGNSTPPPSGPLPAYMGVIVSSKITKSGSTIAGDTLHIVVVKTDPGYQPDPGHPGTGTVVAQVC